VSQCLISSRVAPRHAARREDALVLPHAERHGAVADHDGRDVALLEPLQILHHAVHDDGGARLLHGRGASSGRCPARSSSVCVRGGVRECRWLRGAHMGTRAHRVLTAMGERP